MTCRELNRNPESCGKDVAYVVCILPGEPAGCTLLLVCLMATARMHPSCILMSHKHLFQDCICLLSFKFLLSQTSVHKHYKRTVSWLVIVSLSLWKQ